VHRVPRVGAVTVLIGLALLVGAVWLATPGPAAFLAGLFLAGYAGRTVPVIGLGLLERYTTPQVGLLVFAAALTLIVLTTAPTLLRRPDSRRENGRDSDVSNPDRRPGHKAEGPRALVIGMNAVALDSQRDLRSGTR
jgi:hypothetical protein